MDLRTEKIFMVRSLILLFISMIVLVPAFQNCGSGFSSNPDAFKKALSSSCVANIRAKAEINFPLGVCDDVDSYICEKRIFRPGVGGIRSQESACFTTQDGKEACVRVDVLRFDTESVRSGAEVGSFASGGEYNRDEIQCANTQVSYQNVTLIQSEGESVEAALLEAMRSCKARSLQ